MRSTGGKEEVTRTETADRCFGSAVGKILEKGTVTGSVTRRGLWLWTDEVGHGFPFDVGEVTVQKPH